VQETPSKAMQLQASMPIPEESKLEKKELLGVWQDWTICYIFFRLA
jgi:hypothetical protein